MAENHIWQLWRTTVNTRKTDEGTEGPTDLKVVRQRSTFEEKRLRAAAQATTAAATVTAAAAAAAAAVRRPQ